MSKTIITIAVVLLVVIILGVVAGVFIFTGGGKTKFKTFYVVVDGKPLVTGNVELPVGKAVGFETKYLLKNNSEAEHQGYGVKVVPNPSASNFTFTVDGEMHSFRDETDFTSAFRIKRGKTGFTITNDNLTVENIIKSKYRGKDVVCPAEFLRNEIYFLIEITSKDESQTTVTLGLIMQFGISNVTLDKGVAVF